MAYLAGKSVDKNIFHNRLYGQLGYLCPMILPGWLIDDLVIKQNPYTAEILDIKILFCKKQLLAQRNEKTVPLKESFCRKMTWQTLLLLRYHSYQFL